MEKRYQKELNKKRLRTDSDARPSVKNILLAIKSPNIILVSKDSDNHLWFNN